jgi:hypothetical protein
MSDLVERLRNWNHGIPKTMIVSEAADEIERLELLVAQFRESNHIYKRDAQNDEMVIDELRSQLVKKNEALKRITNVFDNDFGDGLYEAISIAERALTADYQKETTR